MAGDVVHRNEKIHILLGVVLGVVLGSWHGDSRPGSNSGLKKKKLQVNESKGKDE